MGYSVLLALSMFAPLLASVVSGAEIRKIGWKPHIKGNLRWILAAWFAPAALGAAGAALFRRVLFRSTFAYVRASLGVEGLSQLERAGLSLQMVGIISGLPLIFVAVTISIRSNKSRSKARERPE